MLELVVVGRLLLLGGYSSVNVGRGGMEGQRSTFFFVFEAQPVLFIISKEDAWQRARRTKKNGEKRCGRAPAICDV